MLNLVTVHSERKMLKLYYKYLLFDLDHTLLDFDLAEEVALTALLEEEGVTDLDTYKAYYKPMNKQLWRDLEVKKLTKEELVNSRFARLFAHFGQEKDGVYLAGRYQHHLAQQGQAYEGARELLEILTAQGYQLYAATNGIQFIQEGRLSVSGFARYFQQVFISDQIGHQKPDLAFFQAVAERIADFDKTKALMIGDSLTADMAGAEGFGMDRAWYNPKGLEPGQQSLTYEIASYDALLTCLEEADQ